MPRGSKLTRQKRTGGGYFKKGWSVCSNVADRKYYTFTAKPEPWSLITGGKSGTLTPNINQVNWDWVTLGTGACSANLRAAGFPRNDVTCQPFLLGSYDQNIYPTSNQLIGASSPARNFITAAFNCNNGALTPAVASTALDNMKSPEMLEYTFCTPVGYRERHVLKSVKMIAYRNTVGSGFQDGSIVSTATSNLSSTAPIPAGNPSSEMTSQLQCGDANEVPLKIFYYSDYKNRDRTVPFADPVNNVDAAKEVTRMWNTGLVKSKMKRKNRPLSFEFNVSMPLKCWGKQVPIDDTTVWSANNLQTVSYTNAIRTLNQSEYFARYDGAIPHTPGQGIFLWFECPTNIPQQYNHMRAGADNVNQWRVIMDWETVTTYTVCCSIRDGVLGKIGGVVPATLALKSMPKLAEREAIRKRKLEDEAVSESEDEGDENKE